MRHYELVVVFSPTVSEEDVSQAQERTEQFITSDGGEITKKEQLGVKRLAYPIRKSGQTFLEGNYFLTRFSTATASPSELEAHLRISESVLRYLLVRTATAIPPEPPPPRFAPRPQAPVVRTAEAAAETAEAPQGEPVAAPTKATEPVPEVTETPSEEAVAPEPVAEVTEPPSDEAVTVEVEEPAIAEAPEAEPEPETEEPAPTAAEETPVEEKPAKAKKPRAKATTTKTTKTKASSTAKTTNTKAPKAPKSSKSKKSEE